MAQVLQAGGSGRYNAAEQAVLTFLSRLPDQYYIIREPRIQPDSALRNRGMSEEKPDFVVIGPEIGLLCVEVKDWNIVRNTYTWLDQQRVERRDPSGNVIELDSPFEQVERYYYALRELVAGTAQRPGPLDTHYIVAVAAFPFISRQGFLNEVHNLDILRDPQGRFLIDLERALFKEDFDLGSANPVRMLATLATHGGSPWSITPTTVVRTVNSLVPPSCSVGGMIRHEKEQEQIKLLTDRQEKWVHDLRPQATILRDVPGSGKTNVLVSKAMYLVEDAQDRHQPPPRVLITTYSCQLEDNIRRIFRSKLQSRSQKTVEQYERAIQIHCMAAVLEGVLVHAYGSDCLDGLKQPGEPDLAYEGRLAEEAKALLLGAPGQYCQFDYVMVDEIQDFDTLGMMLLRHLCRQGARGFFLVGDVGQKIQKRNCDLTRAEIVVQQAELQKEYKMYRTPRYIAELAVRFLSGNRDTERELRDAGYEGEVTYPNPIANGAEILRGGDTVAAAAQRICDLLAAGYLGSEIMVIGSEPMRTQMAAALTQAGISFNDGICTDDGQVYLVDFQHSKGLEARVVIVAGIEDLYDQTKPAALFSDPQQKRDEESYARRRIYVALTRSTDQLVIYYHDSLNRYVRELMAINRQIEARREVTYGRK